MNKNYIIAIVIGAVILYYVFSKKPQEKKNIEEEGEEEGEGEGNNTLICKDMPSVPIHWCDCEANILDVCGECGGGQTDPALCGGVVDDDGNPSGEEGTMTYAGRTYTTQVITYADGTQLEWMTENFKGMNIDLYISNPVGNTNSACTMYNAPEDLEGGVQHNNFIDYGGLYNHNYGRSTNNIPAEDGWRLPTNYEFINLLSMNDYQMDDLCSITGWEIGLEGTNQGLVNLQGGGYLKNLAGDSGSLITEQGTYLCENTVYSAGDRIHVALRPDTNAFSVSNSSNFASIRLVRVPAPE